MQGSFQVGDFTRGAAIVCMTNSIRPECYLTYAELERALEEIHQTWPHLVQVYAIAESHRGRKLFLLELTNRERGEAAEKPGFYIDANTHAEEVLGSTVALETARHLLSRYGSDDTATFLLDELVIYILPRVNPDGAEYCLTTGVQWVGNGRYLPGEEQPAPGFYFADLNGDGVYAQMRVEDDNGEWKVSERDERLLVQRGPHEYGGTYYRLYPEGRIREYDGAEVLLPRPRDGNINRNFAANWLPERHQYGAGAYPLSEPETMAITSFILAHPNITGAQFYHTHGGVILRPFLNKPDAEFPPGDFGVYKTLGQVGEELTGYKLISVFEDFTTDKDSPRSGTAMEWAYEQLGIVCFSTELWDVFKAAGIERDEFFPLGGRSEDVELRLLRWADEQDGPTGYLPWEKFEHPELGTVEIGGWNRLYTFRNPPASLVQDIAKRNIEFTLAHAAAAPRLVIEELTATHVEGTVYKISATVANAGYLPTNLTQMAVREGQASPVTVSINAEPARQLEVIMGGNEVALGHLSGRAERTAPWSPFGNEWGSPKKRAEWVVKAAEGLSEVIVRAQSAKAGVAQRTVRLIERTERST